MRRSASIRLERYFRRLAAAIHPERTALREAPGYCACDRVAIDQSHRVARSRLKRFHGGPSGSAAQRAAARGEKNIADKAVSGTLRFRFPAQVRRNPRFVVGDRNDMAGNAIAIRQEHMGSIMRPSRECAGLPHGNDLLSGHLASIGQLQSVSGQACDCATKLRISDRINEELSRRIPHTENESHCRERR